MRVVAGAVRFLVLPVILVCDATPGCRETALAAHGEAASEIERRASLPHEAAGVLEAEIGGRKVMVPALKVDVAADVSGDLATVTVTQTFANTFTQPMNVTYLFPLNEGAAVYAMIMEVGNERVRAVIQEKEEAVKTFEAAKASGQAASLLEQHRPNMFTQRVANLMPGLPIKVEIRYVQAVPKVDGAYELVVPLVVGPRYQPAKAGEAETSEEPLPTREPSPAAGDSEATWELETLPAYPPVAGLDIPDTIDKERVGLRVHLDGGMPIVSVNSKAHVLQVDYATPNVADVTLAGGRTIDNRDFVLRYEMAGRTPAAGFHAYRDDRGGFFSLLIEPPQKPADSEIGAREMVFVLDCSGSMAGMPMDASKAFMREALRGLRGKDSFRIIRFSDDATEFSEQPLAATPKNIQRGLAYVDQLEGEGGTEMSRGIVQALDVPVPAGALRIVTFLTDGYIGNEHEILSLIKRKLGGARLYAFGVGTSVNRYLLGKMGEMGRGFVRYMDPTEPLEAVAKELAGRLDAPVLTDIEIDWDGLKPEELAPERVPDLFAGGSVRIQGRYGRGGAHTIKVSGKIAGRKATLPIVVTLPDLAGKETSEDSHRGEAVPLMWARASVEGLMDDLSTPVEWRDVRRDDDVIQDAVTKLGLDFALVTKWTSFVAVSEQVVNAKPEEAVDKAVPLHKPAGVPDSAYGSGAELAMTGGGEGMSLASTFSGSSTPEPGAALGLALCALAAAVAVRRMQRSEA